MQELLLFLGEQSLRCPGRIIREHEIGVEVFGRPASYDTSQDTLVRVQASQLRKKLQQYFAGEGRDEAVIIELPKGSYAPVFRPRESEPGEPVHPAGPPPRRWPRVLPYALAAVFALICVALAIQNRRLDRVAAHGLGHQPAVNRLWRGMFGNGLHNYVVLADGNLLILQNEIKRMLTIGEYQSRAFERLAQDRIQEPSLQRVVLQAVAQQFTTIADAELVHRIALVAASNEILIDVCSARSVSISQINQHNCILTGSRRANPWVSLFEDQLNFTTVFEEEPRSACFVNRAPLPGEKARYCGEWARLMYCRVAYLPNPKRTGHVLLISGTDVQATEAGGDLVTGEAWVRKLRQTLGIRDDEEMPYFEALLQGKELNNTAPQFELVAARRR